MNVNLNPIAQAEEDLKRILATVPKDNLGPVLMDLVYKTVERERLMMDAHEQCGADNPEGKAALCKCHCHQGHYRHYWQPIIKTPTQNENGTFYLMDRCKYCPDIRFKLIKHGWVNEKSRIVAQEFLIRGEYRVLTREEFYEREPRQVDPQLKREVGL